MAACSLVFLLLTVLASAGQASAAEDIEGVWSFNGGQVAVREEADGTFSGTVVKPTKFSNCFHVIGEKMWTEMRPQADGSYWGLHQWFFASSHCSANPELGLTAWRVLKTSDGTRFLRVCFSEPGSTSQPMLTAAGVVSGSTFGCSDSARISSLPTVKGSEADKYIDLPSNGTCFGRKTMRIYLHDPVSDPLSTVRVRLKSGPVRRRAKQRRRGETVIATLNVRGLPKPKFRVSVHLVTVLGQKISANRTYRVCGLGPGKHRIPNTH